MNQTSKIVFGASALIVTGILLFMPSTSKAFGDYPFININTILKNRGDCPLRNELNDYQKYCKPFILNIEKL